MSTWSQVAILPLTKDWQFVPLTELLILRIRRLATITAVRYTSRVYVARALLVQGEWQFHGIRSLYLGLEPIILDDRVLPSVMNGAVLAIKFHPYNRQNFEVKIEIPDGGYDEPDIPIVQCINDIEINDEG